MVHDILHAMSESNDVRLGWSIHISAETHGELFMIILSFNSDLYEGINPVIE